MIYTILLIVYTVRILQPAITILQILRILCDILANDEYILLTSPKLDTLQFSVLLWFTNCIKILRSRFVILISIRNHFTNSIMRPQTCSGPPCSCRALAVVLLPCSCRALAVVLLLCSCRGALAVVLLPGKFQWTRVTIILITQAIKIIKNLRLVSISTGRQIILYCYYKTVSSVI